MNVWGRTSLRLCLPTIGAGWALVCASGCSQIVWRGNLHQALEQASQEGRMVVVWYWKPFNRASDGMGKTVFKTPEVIEQMDGVIPVRVHASFSRKWAQEMGLTEVPSFVAYGPQGQVLRKRDGPMDADQFLAFLAVARLSP